MDKIVFNIAEQDRIFIEKECERAHHTFDSFFKMLLDNYKKPVEAKEQPKQQITQPAQENAFKGQKKANPVRKSSNEENSSEGQG